MSHWEKSTFAKDLTDFLALVNRLEIPVDVQSIYKLEQKFPYDHNYEVKIEDVVFHIDSKISGTVPNEVVKLSIYFTHVCEFDSTKNFENQDPIKANYSFQLKIVGFSDKSDEYVNWWHLDQDEKGENPHKFTHPCYHFHCGGKDVKEINTGNLIMLGAPRLAHPPMDIFLGFHFIIQNFYSNKLYAFVNKLMADETYQDIICRAQKRLWEPYFGTFSVDNQHTDFILNKVFPLYLKVG